MDGPTTTISPIYPSITSPKNHPKDESKKRDRFQFEKFRSPDSTNLRLWRDFARRNYESCKKLISETLETSPEALCEYQLILRAQIAREEGDPRNSVEWLLRAQKHNPKSITIIFELGKSFYLLGEHKRAVEILSKGIDEQQQRSKNVNWKIFYWQALSFYHVLKPPESLNKAQEALLHCSRIYSNADMLIFLGRLLTERGDHSSAVEAYKKCIQLEPENVDLIHNLGMLYLKVGDQPSALATFGKGLSCDPNHVPCILSIASILQNNRDYEAAVNKYRIAAGEFDHSCALWSNIGMCFHGREKLITALICLNKANYLSPLDWKVRFNLGIVYTALKQYASAYHFISSAFSICPKNTLILSTMAVILTELEDYRNAKGAYKKALKMDPNLLVGRVNFSIFELRRNNIADAIKRLGTLSADELSAPSVGELNEMVFRLRKTFMAIAEIQNKDS